nr:capsid [Rabbit astrovirus]
MANKPAPVPSRGQRARRRRARAAQNQQMAQQRARRRRNPPRQRRQQRRTRAVARSEVKREVHRLGLTGPKVAVSQTVTATLGTIGANSSDRVELEMASMLNPALVKETNGSNAFGPIQALAAQFGLWRCVQAHIRFTPLVGSSAVSGTAVRASLNLTSTPGSTSWSGLGARVHRDVNVGQTGIFKLARKQLAGPRESWWLTNTNDDKTQSLGPTIEIHSLGQTVSTYQNTPYAGSLFLVELRATWEFANYLTQPSLATLSKQEAPASSVVIDAATAGEPITMTVTDTSTVEALSLLSDMPYSTLSRATGTSVSSTIFQVVDASVSTAASLLPPPFGWLLAGGWWFVKRVVTSSTRANTVQFQIYASAEDAAADRPCIATGTSTQQNLSGVVQFNQINAPNTGTSTVSVVQSRVADLELQLGDPFGLLALGLTPVIYLSNTFNKNLNGWIQNHVNAVVGLWIQDSQGNYSGRVNQAWVFDTATFTGHGFVASDPPSNQSFSVVSRVNATSSSVVTREFAGYFQVGSDIGSGTQTTLFMLWLMPSESQSIGTATNTYNLVAPTPGAASTGYTSGITTLVSSNQVGVRIPSNTNYLLTACIGDTVSTGIYQNGSQTMTFPNPFAVVVNYAADVCGCGPLGFGAPGYTGLPMNVPYAGEWQRASGARVDLRTVRFRDDPDGEEVEPADHWSDDEEPDLLISESEEDDDSGYSTGGCEDEDWKTALDGDYIRRDQLPPWLAHLWDWLFEHDTPDSVYPPSDEVDWAFQLTLRMSTSKHFEFKHPYDDYQSESRARVQSALGAQFDPETAAHRAMRACPHPAYSAIVSRFDYNRVERGMSNLEAKKEAAAYALLRFSR